MSDYSVNMESMMEMFLFETTTLLEQLDEILIQVEKNNSIDEDHINEIFRIMHTIKGSASMMQISNVATVAHIIEDLFYYIRENGIPHEFYEEAIELVFQGNDFLKGEIDKIQNGQPADTDETELESKIKALLEKLNASKAGNSAQPTAPAKPAESAKPAEEPKAEEKAEPKKEAESANSKRQSARHKVLVHFEDGCEMENMRAYLLVNNLKDYCDDMTYTPSDITSNSETAKTIAEEGFILNFESLVDVSEISRVIENTPNIKAYEFIGENISVSDVHEEASHADAPAAAVTEKFAPNKPNTQAQAVNQTVQQNKSLGAKQQNIINVNLSKLDTLMDIVGEIVITESMVTSSPDLAGLELDGFNKAARQLRKLTDELQDTVMSIRMIPVAGAFQKMYRIVRDMGKKLDKDVDLVLEGEDTEVDKTIIDSIGDPLMHLVRNAMDHAIESKEERARKGKPEQGKITLSATNTGGEVVIAVIDDGKGLDTQYLLNKGKEKGLLTKPENEYTEKEVFNLLMLPGFSTKEQVTEFSGRGVGMDVVKKNIEKVGGTVNIESKKDVGTSIIFKIPLTLAIVDGMEISVGDGIYTLQINSIRESLKVDDKEIIIDSDGNEMIMIRGNCYPIVRLHKLYDVLNPITDLKEGILILVESDDKSVCLFADKLIGEQQVVVKPLPRYLNKFSVKERGITGCTILGDGSISLILDVATIINNY